MPRVVLHLEALAVLLDLIHPLAIANSELVLFDDVHPEGEQILFQDLGKFDLAHQRQLGGLRHHQLAAREMRYRSAKAILLHRQVAQFMRLGGQARCDARGAAAHNEHVENVLLAGPAELANQSIACRPCSMALRTRPMPPSSPAMKRPGTLVSKFSLT